MTTNLSDPAILAFLPSVGLPELLIVLAIVVLILGPKQIPKAARSLGSGLRNFRSSVKGEDGEAPDPELPEKTDSADDVEASGQREASGEVATAGKGEDDS